MIEGLLGLVGTTAGGSLFTAVLRFLQDRAAARQQRAEFEHQQTLARNGQLLDYAKTLGTTDSIACKGTRKREIVLFGCTLFRTTHEYDQNAPYTAPRGWAVATSILLLVATYCAVVFLFADNPGYVIWTYNPAAGPAERSILWGLITWAVNSQEIIQLTTGGVAYLLLYPMLFILSAVLTGTTMGQLKR